MERSKLDQPLGSICVVSFQHIRIAFILHISEQLVLDNRNRIDNGVVGFARTRRAIKNCILIYIGLLCAFRHFFILLVLCRNMRQVDLLQSFIKLRSDFIAIVFNAILNHVLAQERIGEISFLVAVHAGRQTEILFNSLAEIDCATNISRYSPAIELR